MRLKPTIRATLRLAFVTALLAACQSYRPVTYPAESHLPQDPHVELRVTEKSGEQRQAIAMADIVSLEIGEPDTGRTVLFVVGGTVLVALTLGTLLFLGLAYGHWSN